MTKRLQTTAAMSCLKMLLTVFNFIFWCSGVAILSIGIWGRIGMDKYNELSTDDYSNVPYILIGTGAFIIIVGLIGCCATFKNISWLLRLYGLLLFIVLIAELAAGISGLIYRHPLQEGFHKGLTSALHDYGKDGHKSDSDAVDELQESLECCGVEEPADWLNTTYFTNNKQYPESCCSEGNKDDCVLDPNQGDDVTIFNKGCYKKVASFLDKNMVIIGACAMGVAFFQVFGIILACCLAKVINSNKYEMV
ncbi:tetraspanin-7-like [Ptychodera flava]|uniref:tetraspanin-7-like n=1 Tax=Ptychodera flava TaxID=63121 RepID=UPI00396A1D28